MGRHNWVRTIIRCARHRKDGPTLCIRLDLEIPGPLRCTPGGGGVGGTGQDSHDCVCGGRVDVAEVRRRVAEALRRGRDEWVRRDAVVVEL